MNMMGTQIIGKFPCSSAAEVDFAPIPVVRVSRTGGGKQTFVAGL